MIDPSDVPPVADNEILARFATHSNHFRSSDGTITQNLFIPNRNGELSVTRHRDATEEEIWSVAHTVVNMLGCALYGRADIRASDCNVHSLRVIKKPIFPHNPNHADVEGWPPQKEDRKLIASKLAAAASKLISPPPRSQ